MCAGCTQAAAAKHRNIDPLAPVDHSLVEYDDFAKDFYTEHPTIAAMNEQQVKEPGDWGGLQVVCFETGVIVTVSLPWSMTTLQKTSTQSTPP
jgi:hypothetical protein